MLLEKEEFVGKANLICNRNYNKYIPYFTKVLRLSRLPLLKFNGFFMGAMQLGMVRALSKFEGAVREGKKRLEEGTGKDTESLERGLRINNGLIRILKTIADGIAWRTLRFNRPLIRLLSEGKSAGHIDPTYPGLKRVLGIRELFIFNDLTRCLRTADVTRAFKDGRIILYEMKKKGKVIKDARDILEEMKKHSRWFSNQELKQWVAQDAIIRKEILIPVFKNGRVKNKLKIEIMNLDFPIKNHLHKVKQLIKRANRKGFAHALLEDGYYIEVHAYDRLAEDIKGFDAKFQALKNNHELTKPDWYDDREVRKINLSNYDGFFQKHDEYPRNLTPPSVLPFKTKNCVRIMMGHLFISVNFNIDLLKEKFCKAGWEVEESDIFSAFKDEKSFNKWLRSKKNNSIDYLKDEDLFILSKREHGSFHRISLPSTLLVMMISSFYGTDFILDALDSLCRQPKREKRGQRLFTMNFVKERNILV